MQNLILQLYIFFSGKILNRSLIPLYISSFQEQNQNGIMISLYNEIMLSYYPHPRNEILFLLYIFSPTLKALHHHVFIAQKGVLMFYTLESRFYCILLF